VTSAFDASVLSRAVADALAAAEIPEGHTNAFALVATRTGVKAVLTTKVQDHWMIDSIVSVDRNSFDGGVGVKASW
jgi:hypothetical protein